jgi:vancomycin resistance protein YoaR
MAEQVLNKKNVVRRPLLVAGVIVIIAAIAWPVGYVVYLSDRVLPGVNVNGIDIGGMPFSQASAKVNADAAIFSASDALFNFETETRAIKLKNYLKFDVKKGLNEATDFGHTDNIARRFIDLARAMGEKTRFYLPYEIDSAALHAALKNDWTDKETPVSDARFDIKIRGEENIDVKIIPEKSGLEFDYARAVAELKEKIATLDATPVILRSARTAPNITARMAQTVQEKIPDALALAPLSLAADEKKWTLKKSDLAAMLTVRLAPGGTPKIAVDTVAAKKYFTNLAAEYDIPATSTKYEVDTETKKISVFKPGSDGRKINIDKTVLSLESAVDAALVGADGKKSFTLFNEADRSQVVTATAAELGIKEKLGTGFSDFSGSSSNRIINVKNGADKLNGTLIAPDEIFSVNKIIGPVTRENGYVDEQIIKGNLIVREIGGGLCQIGTTAFRAAMMSGMPITERMNHGLVVHYYGDARNGNPGTDATLYDPYADFKFKNDTGHWMLLTTEMDVKTKKLAFTFWGTSDGRKGEYSAPQVIRWITRPADEVQNVEVATMKPGEQKCQNPFSGADTTFTYSVTDKDGQTTERKFNSHYRALPKICMNGPALPTAVEPEKTAAPLSDPNGIVVPGASAPDALPPEAIIEN